MDDDFENVLEYDENELETDFVDLDERARRHRPTPPSSRGLNRTRPSSGPVTQLQFQSALNEIGRKVDGLANEIKKSAGFANSVSARLEKEIVLRKKSDVQQKKAVGQTQMSSMLPFLLMQSTPGFSEDNGLTKLIVKDGVLQDASGKNLEDTDFRVFTDQTKFEESDMTLPLVMMMGMGGDASGSSDNNMMMLMLVMMMQKKK